MKNSLQRYWKMFKYLSLNFWIFCLLNNSLWPKISHLKVKGKSDGYFDQPASVNSWTMSGVSTCIWGTGTQYLAFLEFEHLFPFALLPNQSTLIKTFFPSFFTDSNYGCNTKDFYCCFFWSPQIYIGFTASTLCKKKKT